MNVMTPNVFHVRTGILLEVSLVLRPGLCFVIETGEKIVHRQELMAIAGRKGDTYAE